LEPDSNVTVRISQSLKSLLPIDSTDAGIQIDFSEEPEDRQAEISVSVEPGSNVTVAIPEPEKQRGARNVTDAGMQIDCSDDKPENA
jgi:hypothetical protein